MMFYLLSRISSAFCSSSFVSLIRLRLRSSSFFVVSELSFSCISVALVRSSSNSFWSNTSWWRSCDSSFSLVDKFYVARASSSVLLLSSLFNWVQVLTSSAISSSFSLRMWPNDSISLSDLLRSYWCAASHPCRSLLYTSFRLLIPS